MRKYSGKYIVMLIIFISLGIGAFLASDSIFEGDSGRRNTLANRFVQKIESYPSGDLEEAVAVLSEQEEPSWISLYGKENVPSDVSFIPSDNTDTRIISSDSSGSITCVVSHDNEVAGLVVFTFEDSRALKSLLLTEGVLIFSFIVLTVCFIYIDRKVLRSHFSRSSQDMKIKC